VANGTDLFDLDPLALKFVKIAVRMQTAALAIVERTGTPTLGELVERTEQTAREAVHEIDRWRIALYGQRKQPWPWP
jgi:hypothetical protein